MTREEQISINLLPDSPFCHPLWMGASAAVSGAAMAEANSVPILPLFY